MLVRAGLCLRPPLRPGGGGGLRRLSGAHAPPPAAVRCFPLSRALLRVQGPEAATFLQGLVTNDVARLLWGGGAARPPEGGAPSPPLLPPARAQYTHALNVQGRCLYDLILYRLHQSQEEEPNILLECDYSVLDSVQKHLKLYKIRRKVNIAPCLDLSLWAIIPGEESGDISSILDKCAHKTLVLTPDPRAEVMGWRLIMNKEGNPQEIVPGSHIGDVSDYHRHRYKQGIAEGVKDIPPGIALPLESNLAYMNGISFTKESAYLSVIVSSCESICSRISSQSHSTVSWRHPRSKHWHQLDVVIARCDNLKNVLLTHSYHSADYDTDHSLVCSKLKVIPKKLHRSKQTGRPRIDARKTANSERAEKFRATLEENLRSNPGGADVISRW
ncbi:iron-sulfur cluster assembly factor IBA57, mitochondrial isoform X2 [Carettochelys insculpta]|uniref:iron-sulfur cluster assembly factor IBA57, mitochondrial isoform X2 n=1 Tax=Carettochelys insculpta TaxID=44489 RepID=UPI003EBA0318